LLKDDQEPVKPRDRADNRSDLTLGCEPIHASRPSRSGNPPFQRSSRRRWPQVGTSSLGIHGQTRTGGCRASIASSRRKAQPEDAVAVRKPGGKSRVQQLRSRSERLGFPERTRWRSAPLRASMRSRVASSNFCGSKMAGGWRLAAGSPMGSRRYPPRRGREGRDRGRTPRTSSTARRQRARPPPTCTDPAMPKPPKMSPCRRCWREVAEPTDRCAVCAGALCSFCWDAYGYCPAHTHEELERTLEDLERTRGGRHRWRDVKQ
jgi:hypothetical protein